MKKLPRPTPLRRDRMVPPMAAASRLRSGDCDSMKPPVRADGAGRQTQAGTIHGASCRRDPRPQGICIHPPSIEAAFFSINKHTRIPSLAAFSLNLRVWCSEGFFLNLMFQVRMIFANTGNPPRTSYRKQVNIHILTVNLRRLLSRLYRSRSFRQLFTLK